MIPELLESRIAPAGVVIFTDVDGDIVTVKSSKGTQQALEDALTFSAPSGPRQLQSINFEQPNFLETNLTITSKQAGGGDGLVNVGQIRLGGGQAYGTFSIEGDLATIGGGGATGSIKKLSVHSLGMLGNSTVPGGAGTPFAQTGLLGALEVKGSVASDVQISGDLKTLKIGGDIIGGTDASVGRISITGKLIAGTVGGFLLGNSGAQTGSIIAESIGSLTISGGMRAAGGDLSGAVIAQTGGIDKLVIKGDILGGTATLNARQIGGGFIKLLQIDGSVLGGNGTYDDDLTQPGQIFARDGFGTILIKGDVIGGNSDYSGTIAAGIDADAETTVSYRANAPVGKVTINGSLSGGGGDFSGSLLGEGSKDVKIGRDLIGGSGVDSGILNVEGDPLGNIVINGSIIGGSGEGSGRLIAETEEGPRRTITVGGSVLGGGGPSSGTIEVNEDGFSKITVGGMIAGGVGNESGIVDVSTESGNSFAVKIGGSVKGGVGNDSGGLRVDGDGKGTLVLNGSIEFGSGQRSGFLRVDEMKSVLITGSVLGGFNNSGHIQTEEVIGSLTIGGSVVGVQSTARILAMPDDPTVPVPANVGHTIEKLVIKGDVRNAEILAGYELIGGVLTGQTADASFGTVEVGGNWVFSNLVAGVNRNTGGFGDLNDFMIGTVNDPTITARIASITIKGTIQGIPGGTDTSGFVAQQIDAFKYAKNKLPTRAPNALDPAVTVGPTLDVFVRELV